MCTSENESEIKYAIVGSGAIGLGLAHLLKDAHCTLLTRDTRQHQFEVTDKYGSLIPIKAAQAQLSTFKAWQSIDLLIIPVKYYQLPALIETLQGLLPPSLPLLLLQNGIGGHEMLQTAFPHNPIYAASTTDGIFKQSDSSIRINARGELLVGGINNQQEILPIRFLLASHPNARWEEDIMLSLYKKLAVNAVINPISAKFGCKNREVREHANLLNHLKREIYSLYSVLEVALDTIELDEYIDDVIDNTGKNHSSMLQDVMRKRPTEIDGILGALLKKAEAHAMRLEHMQTLYEDIKALERSYSQ